jgi:2-dehydropantoate 2-reductase
MNNSSYKLVGQKRLSQLPKTLSHTKKPSDCETRMKFQGRTATGIILKNQNEILLIKRSTPPFAGYWALPGGRSEPNEAVEQTVIREVKEETGLKVSIIRKIGEYHEQGTQMGQEYDYYPACFLVKDDSGKINKQESEIAEIKFFNINELPEVLAFEHAQMINDYLNQKANKR